MTTIQYNLGGGTTIALPADIAVKQLIEQLQRDAQQTIVSRPKIGEYLSGQGGVYVGNILGNDGTLYGRSPKGKKTSATRNGGWTASGTYQIGTA